MSTWIEIPIFKISVFWFGSKENFQTKGKKMNVKEKIEGVTNEVMMSRENM